MHILGLPTDIFNVYPATVKFKTYQARWQIGDIYVSGDARKTEDTPQGLGEGTEKHRFCKFYF